MLKLLKGLKSYRLLLLVVAILVACTSFAALYLPDRMSRIIGEGITTEIVYETYNGQVVYIDGAFLSSEDIPLVKIIHKDSGELVLNEKEGKYYAIFDIDLANSTLLNPILFTEIDSQGKEVSINPALLGLDASKLPPLMLTESGAMKIPRFVRTDTGQIEGIKQPGFVLLDDGGNLQIQSKQVSKTNIIVKNGLIMLGVTFASSIFSIIVALISSKVAMGFGHDIRKKLFSKVISFSQQEDTFGTSSLITRSTNDIQQIQHLVMMSQRIMFNVPVMFVGGIIMALRKDARMTLVLLVTLPVVILIILIVGRIIIPLFTKMQKKIDALTRVTRENITGVRVVRAFQADEFENNRFDESNKDVTRLGLVTGRLMASLMPIMTFIMSSTLLSIMIIATYRTDTLIRSGGTNFQVIGNMMAVIQYVVQIMVSVIMLTMIIIMIPRASVSAKRINEVLDSVNPIKEREDAFDLEEEVGDVVFENVTFSYPNAANPALSDVSFTASKGEFVAIIGGTGSGKSSLIQLLPRLYDTTRGSITVNGKDIKDISLQSLRKKIGFVPQKAILFSGNIRENIAYGASDQSDSNITLAADIAQASGFIEEKEGKMQGVVEQDGANFSGGQKQRLSIARAIARNPEIYIFDDSFSALDFKTDAVLRRELRKITKNSIVFIVAQRIGTVMDADKIIVLDEGKIVGYGKHSDLIKTCETYKDIANTQLSEQELATES